MGDEETKKTTDSPIKVPVMDVQPPKASPAAPEDASATTDTTVVETAAPTPEEVVPSVETQVSDTPAEVVENLEPAQVDTTAPVVPENEAGKSSDITDTSEAAPALSDSAPAVEAAVVAEQPPVPEIAPAPAETSEQADASNGEVAATAAPTAENPMAIPTKPMTPHKAGAPMGAVIAAVVVAVLLAVVAVVAYMKTSNKSAMTDSKSSTASSARSNTSSAITTAAVDATTATIDNSLNSVNDATDFNAADLSDATLGL